MKTYLKVSTTFLFLILIFSHIACEKEIVEPITVIEEPIIVSTLTEQELNDLKILREEEKLARDVYRYAYSKYSLLIFNNISNSEQSHMDQVLVILEANGIEDPADEDMGVFNNDKLQNLYNDLTTEVDISETNALLVGATIEDLDIYDIQEFFNNTEKEEVLNLYTVLECGSRNHMRSFYKKITNNGETYTPQFISQDEYDSIVSSEKETCSN